jgi:hypothetical protein
MGGILKQVAARDLAVGETEEYVSMKLHDLAQRSRHGMMAAAASASRPFLVRFLRSPCSSSCSSLTCEPDVVNSEPCEECPISQDDGSGRVRGKSTLKIRLASTQYVKLERGSKSCKSEVG